MSETTGAAFFGAVLRAIACTRNDGPEGEAYDKGVIEPARRIRDLEKEVGERPLTQEENARALGWPQTILATKRVTDHEREHHRTRIAAAGGLTVLTRGRA